MLKTLSVSLAPTILAWLDEHPEHWQSKGILTTFSLPGQLAAHLLSGRQTHFRETLPPALRGMGKFVESCTAEHEWLRRAFSTCHKIDATLIDRVDKNRLKQEIHFLTAQSKNEHLFTMHIAIEVASGVSTALGCSISSSAP